jgi:hypothetical protein
MCADAIRDGGHATANAGECSVARNVDSLTHTGCDDDDDDDDEEEDECGAARVVAVAVDVVVAVAAADV